MTSQGPLTSQAGAPAAGVPAGALRPVSHGTFVPDTLVERAPGTFRRARGDFGKRSDTAVQALRG